MESSEGFGSWMSRSERWDSEEGDFVPDSLLESNRMVDKCGMKQQAVYTGAAAKGCGAASSVLAPPELSHEEAASGLAPLDGRPFNVDGGLGCFSVKCITGENLYDSLEHVSPNNLISRCSNDNVIAAKNDGEFSLDSPTLNAVVDHDDNDVLDFGMAEENLRRLLHCDLDSCEQRVATQITSGSSKRPDHGVSATLVSRSRPVLTGAEHASDSAKSGRGDLGPGLDYGE